MKLKDKLIKLRKKITNKPKPLIISDEDKFKLLSAFYTYNHGDKGCAPFEYACKAGCKENGGGDYLEFEKVVNSLGFKISNIVFIKETISPKHPRPKTDFEELERTKTFKPEHVDHFVLETKDKDTFMLKENPDYIIFLAKNGDERAKETAHNFEKKLGMSGMHENIYETPRETIKRQRG